MSKFAYKLRQLPDSTDGHSLFDRVWSIVKECGEEERHFNQLQSVYRGIASTWLLATFAAVGYLLFSKDTQSTGNQMRHLFSALICLLGAWGIGLIWPLDLKVYHRLLVAVFEEGRKLENEFDWLPRLRTNMYRIERKQNKSRDPIREMLAAYYVGTVTVCLFAFWVFVSWYLRKICVHHWYYCTLPGSALSVAVLCRAFWWTTPADLPS